VTTGEVVVVVGAAPTDERAPEVACEDVGIVVDVDSREGCVELDAAAELAPGCSLATMTPIRAVPPTAARAAARVRRCNRASARWRDSGEWCCSGRFMVGVGFLWSGCTHPTSAEFLQP